MSKQAVVIGLGQFGMALARALAKNGSEVLAVDLNAAHIHDIAPHVADAVLMDAMDEEALAALAPARRDTCVCAIGDDNREGSIIVTALLKQLGAKHIVARATNDLHARILTLVGADEVINPERSYGERLAVRLAWRNVINMMPLGGDLVLTEVAAPESFLGRNLTELALPRRFSVNVSAVRRERDGVVQATVPDALAPIEQGDILLLVSTEAAVRKLTERS
jgi:trk system potassium uptake protein TrkA